jgi:hypothetical protein
VVREGGAKKQTELKFPEIFVLNTSLNDSDKALIANIATERLHPNKKEDLH